MKHYPSAVGRPLQLAVPSSRWLSLLPGYLQASLIPRVGFVTAYCQDHKYIAVDTLKNTCDLFIPLSALGGVRISAGVIGILGIVSSLAGIVALMDPSAKMTPS